MKKTNKKKLEEFIRVDHAGERGAIKIYEGQLLALNTVVRNDELKKTIGEMKKHEQEHSNFFEEEISNQLNYYHCGIYLDWVLGLVQQSLEKKPQCYVQPLLKR